jgi:hypothetical protein
MVTAQEIRQAIARFVADGNLDAFEDWVALHTWNAARDSDATARVLVADTELRLSEYSDGHLPLEQMLAEFREIATGMPVMNVRIVHGGNASCETSSGSIIPVGPAVVEMGGMWFEVSPEEARALAGPLQSSHQSSAGPPLAYSER